MRGISCGEGCSLWVSQSDRLNLRTEKNIIHAPWLAAIDLRRLSLGNESLNGRKMSRIEESRSSRVEGDSSLIQDPSLMPLAPPQLAILGRSPPAPHVGRPEGRPANERSAGYAHGSTSPRRSLGMRWMV